MTTPIEKLGETALAVLHDNAPPQLPVTLLVAFTRQLIRNNPNQDLIYLSALAAQEETGATDVQLRLMTDALLAETSRSHWPDGFFR